ncbi:MAG: penicillin acylase family protein [Deltaproteobacteria bacterium]|nr:penicillin acylase family protein [Deltaproteobacteria bacterium]
MKATWALMMMAVLLLTAACGGGDDAEDTGGAGQDGGTQDTGGGTPDAGTPDAGGEDTGGGTGIEALKVDEEKPFAGLDGRINVVRDSWGVPHIYAASEHDLFFAIGYMHAKDRYFQMETFRRFPSGTLAELFGAVALQADEPIRIHHMRKTAQEVYDALPADSDIKKALDAYAEGVNAFVGSASGMDLGIELSMLGVTPKNAAPWTGVDCLAFGRYQTYDLSYDNYLDELDYADAVSALLAAFPQGDPREGILADLHTFKPPRQAAVHDTWPDGTTHAAWKGMPQSRADRLAVYRDRLPRLAGTRDLLRKARERLAVQSPAAGLKPRLLCDRGKPCGSNNWIVGPTLSASGGTMLANDTHLGLDNPPVWYEMHMDLARSGAADLSVMGVSFPAGPGVILGHNGHLAWGATVEAMDVTDYFVEDLDPDGGGRWGTVTNDPDGSAGPEAAVQVEIVARNEQFRYRPDEGSDCAGSVPQPVKDRHPEWAAAQDGDWCVLSIDYPEVPHHGPVLAFSEDGTSAITVHWTGHDPSNEVLAFFLAGRAKTQAEFEDAFDNFRVGAQNMVMIGRDGHIFHTGSARVPVRRSIDRTHPPYLPMPGTGDYDWIGEVDDTQIPHALDPAKGYVVTANNDPLGIAFDGDPLNEVLDDGKPYLGFVWDVGWRAGRITDRITNATGERPEGAKLTPDDIKTIQSDHFSNSASVFVDVLRQAVADAEAADADAPDSDPALKGMLTAKMKEAWGTYLNGWNFIASSGVRNETTQDDVKRSIAASIYNLWLTTFVPYAVGDELGAAGAWMSDDSAIRGLHHIIKDEAELVMETGPDGRSIIFDDVSTDAVTESLSFIALKALADAIARGAATPVPGGFGTDDLAQWQWGKLHTLTLEHASGEDSFNIPTPNDKDFPHGFPRHGDNWAVDACDYGVGTLAPDYDFSYSGGPAIRMVIEMTSAGVRAWNAIPGGQVGKMGNKHYDDQIRNLWSVNDRHEWWYAEDEVVANAEWRLVLKPQ